MNTYKIIYRGKVIDTIKAASTSEAMQKADKAGYSITMVEIKVVK